MFNLQQQPNTYMYNLATTTHTYSNNNPHLAYMYNLQTTTPHIHLKLTNISPYIQYQQPHKYM